MLPPQHILNIFASYSCGIPVLTLAAKGHILLSLYRFCSGSPTTIIRREVETYWELRRRRRDCYIRGQFTWSITYTTSKVCSGSSSPSWRVVDTGRITDTVTFVVCYWLTALCIIPLHSCTNITTVGVVIRVWLNYIIQHTLLWVDFLGGRLPVIWKSTSRAELFRSYSQGDFKGTINYFKG